MNKTRFATKALLSLLVVLVVLGSAVTLVSADETFQNYKLAYGEIVPTDANLEAQKFSYSLYGDSDDLYFMRISKGTANSYFGIEIYSDSNYQNQIRSYTKSYDLTPGNKPLKVTWEFKSVPSGTYYGRCYTYIEVDGNRHIDTASMKTFTINIDRISKKTVQLTSLVNTNNGPKISWTPFATATKYNVYRRCAGDKYWTYITTLGANATSYTDTAAKSGNYYAYTVKCSDGKYVSLYNKNGLYIKYLATPNITVVGAGAAGSAKIQWPAVNGASGYYIYRKGGSLSDYNWKLIANVKNGKATYYIDKTATSSDWNYTYTVKAYSGNHLSARNMAGIDFDYIPAPTLKRASSYYGGMQIEWTCDNPNVKHYNVYRKNGSTWKYLGSTKEKTFLDKTAVSNNTYTYTVKAYSDTNAGAYNATGITAKYLQSPGLEKLTFDSSYRSIVKWNSVDGATGYKVYRKINNAKSWTLIATIKDAKTTTYYDACKKASGYTYTYTVRAFDSKNIHSFFVLDGTTAVCLAKPLFTSQQITTEDGSLCIETKWGAINGATAYNVYRRLPGGTWETLIEGTTELSYLDTSVECGVVYEYSVKAVNDKGDISPTYTKSAVALIIPRLENVTVTEEGSVLTWYAVENADSYTVYRRAKGTDTWEAIAKTTTAGYTDASEEGKAQPFYYTVSATFGQNESSFYDGIPNFTEIVISAEYIPATEESLAHIAVDFSCPDAEIIEVYKSTNDEEPILLEGVTGNFEDSGIEDGNIYTYTVVAITSGKVNGTASASAKYPHPPLEAAVINCIGDYNDGESTVTITWNEVTFADEYVILRKSFDGEWEEIGTVVAEPQTPETEENTPEDDVTEAEIRCFTYTDTDVLTEVPYSYKVKAIATKSERDSSESEVADILIVTPLESVTGLKFSEPQKNKNGTVSVTITWDETLYAESYTLHRKTEDSDWELLYCPSASGDLSYTDTVKPNIAYIYKVEASAPDRGTVANQENFCWTEEYYVDIVSSDNTYIYDNYIVITASGFETINDIVTAKDGYTAEADTTVQFVGTGTILNIYKDGEPVTSYTLIIKGDVTGDGVCDTLDCSEIEKIVSKSEQADETISFAADMNDDGEITAEDLELVKNKAL